MKVVHLKVDFCFLLYRSTYHELMVLFMCLRFYSIVVLILTHLLLVKFTAVLASILVSFLVVDGSLKDEIFGRLKFACS